MSKWEKVAIRLLKTGLLIIISLALVACTMNAWSDCHYQQIERYEEMK